MNVLKNWQTWLFFKNTFLIYSTFHQSDDGRVKQAIRKKSHTDQNLNDNRYALSLPSDLHNSFGSHGPLLTYFTLAETVAN
jgi:hypothetical protein